MTAKHSSRVRVLGAAAAIVVVAGLTSCSSSSGPKSASGSSDVLRTAFYANMQVPDPDVFYEAEGLQVTMSCYDGLLQYDPAASDPLTAKIVGAVAKSWTQSSDGLTYTFTLRDDAKFVDGKAATSADVLYSFQRRTKLGQGPAYMLADVASYEAPSATQFVVHLKTRNTDFLGYLASPYSPKVYEAAVVMAHAGSDNGQTWLSTHSAGTGPFSISDFVPSDHYTLTRNDNYWGGKPPLREIQISIIPDQTTAVLELQRHQLDIIHNVTPQTLEQFKTDKTFQEIYVPAVQVEDIHVNPNKPPFNNDTVRLAMRQAMDLSTIVPQVWGAQGSPSKQMVPPGELPDNLGQQVWQADPGPLKAAAASLPAGSKDVEIVYQTGLIGDQHMSEALQTVLNTAGFNATVRPVPISEIFSYRDAPESKVPNIVIELENPDTKAPTNFAEIYYGKDAFLNFVKGGSAQADALIAQAKQSADENTYNQLTGQALDLLFQQGDFILPAAVQGVFVASTCVKGYTMNAVAPYTLGFAHATVSCS